MEPTHSMLLPSLVISWAVITGILAVLVVYRITLAGKETSEIDINAAEPRRLQDQEVLVSKMARLKVPIIVLVVISGVLLLTSAGIWIYQGLLSS
jgi:hypothetical protein